MKIEEINTISANYLSIASRIALKMTQVFSIIILPKLFVRPKMHTLLMENWLFARIFQQVAYTVLVIKWYCQEHFKFISVYFNSVHVETKFCDDTRDNNTCSFIRESPEMEFCQYLHIVNVPLSHLLEKSRPPLFCPIKKGSIIFDEAPIDGEVLGR